MGRGASITSDSAHRENYALAPRSTPKIKARFYRAGSAVKSTDYGIAHQAYSDADLQKPVGHVGRLNGLFCVPSLPEVAQWVRSNAMSGPAYDPQPTELFYTGPEPFIYPVIGWHRACRDAESGHEDAYLQNYWEQGLPLSAYKQIDTKNEHLWSMGGEMLIDPQFLTSSRAISMKRLLAHTPDRFSDLENVFKQWQRRYRL